MHNLLSIAPILCPSDSFWAGATPEMLGMVMSTCKEFHNELRESRNTNPLLTSALKAMIRGNPSLKVWELTFNEAMNRFGISNQMLINHCRRLPRTSKYNLSEQIASLILCSGGYCTSSIPFLDAFTLASRCPGGLSTSMEIKHQRAIRAIGDGRAILENFDGRLREMERVIEKAVNTLDAKRTLTSQEHRNIMIFKNILVDIEYARVSTDDFRHMLDTPNIHRDPISINQQARLLKAECKQLLHRYNAHLWRVPPTQRRSPSAGCGAG